MSDLPKEILDGFRTYLGFGPDDTSGPVWVRRDDTADQTKSQIEDILPQSVSGSPEGRGRLVVLPAGRLTTGQLMLSQMQSLRGVKGSTILTLESAADLESVAPGYGAYITIKDDFRSVNGIAGQGVIEDLDIDLINSESALLDMKVHGLFAPEREPPPDSATIHTLRNVAVYNATGDGIHFAAGNDKLVCDRLRSERAQERGIHLEGGDIKARAIGSVAKGSALSIDGAAIEMDQFDLWRTSPNAQPTLSIIGGVNGCVIKSGTVEGCTYFKGKNNTTEDDDNNFLNSKAQFAFVHFKYDPAQDCEAYLEIDSADLVELVSCKFGRSGPNPSPPPDPPEVIYDYLIKITNTVSDINRGIVKIVGASGMIRYMGRATGTNKRMVIDAAIHICNIPELLLFEWGPLGTVEMVPARSVDPSNDLRTHLRCDGTEYDPVLYPFAYLNWAAYSGTTVSLASMPSTFKMPNLPALSVDSVPAMRLVP